MANLELTMNNYQAQLIVEKSGKKAMKEVEDSRRDEWSTKPINNLLDVYETKWNHKNYENIKGGDWEDVVICVSAHDGGVKSSKSLFQCKYKVAIPNRENNENLADSVVSTSIQVTITDLREKNSNHRCRFRHWKKCELPLLLGRSYGSIHICFSKGKLDLITGGNLGIIIDNGSYGKVIGLSSVLFELGGEWMLRSVRVSKAMLGLHDNPTFPLTCVGLVQRQRSLRLAEIKGKEGLHQKVQRLLFDDNVLALPVGLGLWGVVAHGHAYYGFSLSDHYGNSFMASFGSGPWPQLHVGLQWEMCWVSFLQWPDLLVV
eukprot:Gb_36989 [translate_table: standard]